MAILSVLFTGLLSTYPIASIIVLAVIVYFIPMKDMVKGYLFGFIPGIVTTSILILEGFAVSNHYIYFVSIGIVVLYFETKLLIVYGVTVNAFLGALLNSLSNR